MLKLDQVTLLCIETRSPDLAIFAIQKCIANIKFQKVVLVTDLKIPYNYPKGIELTQAPDIRTTSDYSKYLLSDLEHLIEGTHVLVMQWDSFVINPELWEPIFLEYDYIGAPWPHHPKTPVGNGGFSLRSLKLIQALKDPRVTKRHPEDQSICIDNKLLLEDKLGIKFAPVELAEKFSFERGVWRNSFGFHGLFNFSKILNDPDLENLIKQVPKDFLGGPDTYELIEDLTRSNRIKTALKLLQKTKPKPERHFRFHKMHAKIWLRLFLKKLITPYSR
jgi:Protein of unknown function (DUF5672)